MTADDFREMALSLPEGVESAHMEHPDFRVGGRIFASLGYPDEGWGMVILPVEEQARVCEEEPEVFVPAKGAWGRGGSTQVNLMAAKKSSVKVALKAAYEERVRKNGKKILQKKTKGTKRELTHTKAPRHKEAG